MERIMKECEPGQFLIYCPGCCERHAIHTEEFEGDALKWKMSGSKECPTFTPSLLVRGLHDGSRCHSFIRKGCWEFLLDCTHDLAGKTVEMVPVSEWPE